MTATEIEKLPAGLRKTGIRTRQSLLERLRDWNDEKSWREFYDIYWKLIYQFSIKAGLTRTEAEDALQDTILSVCKHMPQFRYDPHKGSFKNWLLKLTKWRIVDQLRKRSRATFHAEGLNDVELKAIDSSSEPADSVLDVLWEREWQRNLMDAAMRRVKLQVNPKHYQMFDLHVLKEWSVPRICKELNVSAAHVYLAKHRISKLVKREVKALEAKAVFEK